ncbi:OmpA family protein [Cryomorpha ignava]|uniref:OmpA family protein n=1 Tax=Cryomorpha ignava TaxID=101383 RepID=A0A7K3WKM0_9FLAO|nr:OmpA family protein [Cryomorpha ignava]NEN22044.1 OmpA family protein [Cryomorpha ignava]
MKNNITVLLSAACVATVLYSCVPNRQFTDVKNKQEACEAENKQLRANAEVFETRLNEFDSKYTVAEKKIEALKSDTAVMGNSLRILRKQYDKINALNDELLSKSASLNAGSEREKNTLMAELEELRVRLLAKEDALNELESTLNSKEEELQDREQKLTQLRQMIQRKDSAMQALRASVSKALLGFEGKGITVEKRNGRVYVSMEAQLLFATGSTEIDQKGKQAVIDLARAIQGNDDLHIMVEGHTDTDEFSRTTYPRNNWDLSVLRATSVIKLMTENSDIDPRLLTAAGRSQYQPVDPANKAKNRRIEVILSPKLDELFDAIQADEVAPEENK